MLREQVLVSTLRLYQEESVDPFKQYDAVCTLKWETDEVVWMVGLHGTITRSLLKELCAWFMEKGVKLVKAHRDGSRRLPAATVLPDGHSEIDIAVFAKRFGVTSSEVESNQ